MLAAARRAWACPGRSASNPRAAFKASSPTRVASSGRPALNSDSTSQLEDSQKAASADGSLSFRSGDATGGCAGLFQNRDSLVFAVVAQGEVSEVVEDDVIGAP